MIPPSACIGALAILGSWLACGAAPVHAMDARQKICLNGVWDFKAAGTSKTEIPKGGWAKHRIPGTWMGHGAGDLHVPAADAGSNHAWFHRTFFVPASWNDGRRIKLRFLALNWAHKIFVNGKPAGEHKSMRLCFDVDITSLVQFGRENDLAVWVQKRDTNAVEAGIIRSVYLVSLPPVHVEYSHALPSVEKMTLTIRARVRNDGPAKRVVTVQPVVKDNGKTVLTLPARIVEVAAGGTADVETSSVWKDPVIWGFGIYGKPYLYHLETTLSGETVCDTHFDRFGFREFKTKGQKFYLNGKPFFIKGDLISRFWPVTEHPDYVAAYYQVMRSANLNFQRLHGTLTNDFDSHYWYQVADELGHLVEAQMCKTQEQTDHPEHLALWTAYVNENFNHPSLVMWCPDNENLRPGYSTDLAQAGTVMPPWNRLIGHIRKLDPTRIVDPHDGCYLFAGVQLGVFDRANYMTFNIHPYGKLVTEIERAKRLVGFDNSVPILVGEIFPFPAKIDMIGNPMGTFVEAKRRGRMFQESITDVRRHGAAGVILCALQDTGFLGFSKSDELHLGAWSDYILVRDESKPDKPVVGERICKVKIRWPSLSGEGTKCLDIMPTCGTTGEAGGYGFNYNWFDPTRPIFYPNVTDRMVRQAFHQIDNRDEPPLGPERGAEVIVCFGVDGKPVEGAYVYLLPQDGQVPPPSAVATDADGTAWFHFWDTGRYVARVEYRGKTVEKAFTVAERPKLSPKPGYDYITWVDLGGINVEQRKKELARPAEFTESVVRTADELLTGGDMDYWPGGKQPYGWREEALRETTIRKSGKSSLKLTGNQTQMTRLFRLAPGQRVKISGWIYKVAGENYGCIGIRNGNWDWLIKLDGSTKPGEWKYVEKEYTATGSETYFYCLNYYMGNSGVCIFDEISVKDLKTRADVPFRPGPFDVDSNGFICDWLVLGPFPNEPVQTKTDRQFSGFRTDYITSPGGEAGLRPVYGQSQKVKFPASDFWVEGDEVLTWRDRHSANMVSLNDVLLPSRGISISPPSNVCAYVACRVESPVARKVTLAIGSDDCHKIWLNGEMVGAVAAERGAIPDQDTYPVELRKGDNLLVVKVFQSIGEWQFCVRFLDDQNKPVKDLKIKLKD